MKISLSLFGMFILVCCQCIAQQTVYFLAGQMPNIFPSYPQKDCFVIPMVKQDHIDEARRLIREVPIQDRPFLDVRVAKGADGINRNYSAVGALPWSWHVTEFLGFSSSEVFIWMGIASPLDLEQQWFIDYRIKEWNGTATIAFYTIVAELELPLAVDLKITQDKRIELSWKDMGPGFYYTVETSESLDSEDWTPAPGEWWPISSTEWTDNSPGANSSRFYRVKAQFKHP